MHFFAFRKKKRKLNRITTIDAEDAFIGPRLMELLEGRKRLVLTRHGDEIFVYGPPESKARKATRRLGFS